MPISRLDAEMLDKRWTEIAAELDDLRRENEELKAENRALRNPVRQAQGAWSPVDGSYVE